MRQRFSFFSVVRDTAGRFMRQLQEFSGRVLLKFILDTVCFSGGLCECMVCCTEMKKQEGIMRKTEKTTERKKKTVWRRTAGILLAGLLLLLAVGCGAKKEAADETQSANDAQNGGSAADAAAQAEIKVKDYGTITVALDRENAPITVDNFVKLAKEGFYDGLTFHRIIDGFMIQGGDPNGDGTGGSDETIKGEFSQNGVENTLSHKRGVISMARSQDMDSASSQFFIVQADSTYLDGQYAAFGTVTAGMEVVDEICKTVTGQDQNGIVPKENQPVIESITVLE